MESVSTSAAAVHVRRSPLDSNIEPVAAAADTVSARPPTAFQDHPSLGATPDTDANLAKAAPAFSLPPVTLVPMAHVGGGIAGAGDGMEAMQVIHDAVPIVVNVVSRYLAGIHLEIGRQVLMRHAEPGVHHGDHHGAGLGANIPGTKRRNVRTHRPPECARVAQRPRAVFTVCLLCRRDYA